MPWIFESQFVRCMYRKLLGKNATAVFVARICSLTNGKEKKKN
jgi:hypothetical protein